MRYGSFFAALRLSEKAPDSINWQPALFMLQRLVIGSLFILLPRLTGKLLAWTQLVVFIYSVLLLGCYTAHVKPFAQQIVYFMENINTAV